MGEVAEFGYHYWHRRSRKLRSIIQRNIMKILSPLSRSLTCVKSRLTSTFPISRRILSSFLLLTTVVVFCSYLSLMIGLDFHLLFLKIESRERAILFITKGRRVGSRSLSSAGTGLC